LKGLTASAVPMTINKSQSHFPALIKSKICKNYFGNYSPKNVISGLTGPLQSSLLQYIISAFEILLSRIFLSSDFLHLEQIAPKLAPCA
jgi:hypothetical protein